MTDTEKITMVKTLSGESDDDTVSTYLYIAGQKILRLVSDDTETEVPSKYDGLHVEAAVYLLNKRGGEGETAHSENGVSRTYESSDLPASLLLSYGLCGRARIIS